jgi:hypothetical protein
MKFWFNKNKSSGRTIEKPMRPEAEIEIFEDKYEQTPEFADIRNQLMTPEQIKRAEFYLQQYNMLKGEMDERMEEWEDLQRRYRADIEIENEEDPNSFVPLINPTVEGQIQTLDIDPQVTCTGQGWSDHQWARTGEILTNWAFRENKIRKLIKRHERRRRGYVGTAFFKVVWDFDALDGFGMPKITCPSPTKLFIDGKIKDFMRFQEADFIIEEIGLVSIMKLRQDSNRKPINGRTMDEIADAIALGNNELDFDGEESGDDQDSFTLLHVWTRNNKEGNFQLIEMSKCGIIISESDSSEPYYKYVKNKYPYFITILYENEGSIYGFGDGKLLKRLETLLNNLWDEAVLACRHSAQNKTFVDPKAKIDPLDYEEGSRNPSHLIVANDPAKHIQESVGKGINAVVFHLIELVIREAQRIIRFSSLKTGNDPGRRVTARQASIETMEGERGMDDKKSDLSDTLEDVAKYCIALMMEYFPAPKALRITENDDFEWVDAREMTSIPALAPPTSEYLKSWREERDRRIKERLEQPGETKDPEFMYLTEEVEEKDEEGNPIYEEDKETKEKRIKKKIIPVTKVAEFDIKVSIGEGLPTNKVALYNLIISLAHLQVPDEMGVPRSILTYEKVKKMLADLLDIDIDDERPMANSQEQMYMQAIRQAMAGQGGMQPGRQQRPPLVPNSSAIPGETVRSDNVAI